MTPWSSDISVELKAPVISNSSSHQENILICRVSVLAAGVALPRRIEFRHVRHPARSGVLTDSIFIVSSVPHTASYDEELAKLNATTITKNMLWEIFSLRTNVNLALQGSVF